MSKKAKILYIGDALSIHGSTPTSVETLGRLLSEFYDVKMVSNKKNQILRLFDMLSSVVKFRRETDMILIDTYSSKNFYYALLVSQLARLLKVSYFTCLRGGSLPSRLERSPFLSKLIFNNSVMNVAPSQYLLKAFEEHHYKVQFITNNIDLSKYPQKRRENISPNILYVRAFSKIYNPQMAIKAFSMFKEEFLSAKMCMIGPDKDGTLQECQELAKKLGLHESIELTGKLSKEEWIKRSSDYDIFINPTNFDNQPVSVMEAMALGFPIVSTNVGGIPFLIEDEKDGLLVNISDENQMYEKMSELMKTPLLVKSLSENALLKAENFDWKSVQNEWKKLLTLRNDKNDL